MLIFYLVLQDLNELCKWTTGVGLQICAARQTLGVPKLVFLSISEGGTKGHTGKHALTHMHFPFPSLLQCRLMLSLVLLLCSLL